ncbi:5-bromo-4-chloroindolyl phosphate hydrolysis family protein [Falsirhodobacter algicola]|uniref:5-bromo-4-chloroindolyl phosphate hydrolysis protein n=1 Tax=Falsirhodobacter algicola TaxID=2692330 RepID=A0A8J8SKR7_9RHOB|nr:5-bromo-4-chloroindolyl phosphate hydrolysis family protein [Falsirhodobacter algicola]QUS35654.1 hypothetical protein GR316_04830 [Falsirhodobacter algicola]
MTRTGRHLRSAFDGRRRLRGGTRARLLLLPAILFFLGGFGGGTGQMLAGFAACALLFGASHLTREGLRAEIAFDLRPVARAPSLPRKLMGAGLTGLALAIGSLPQGGLLQPLILGVLGAGLHVASFGADPLRGKGGSDADRVGRAVDRGEAFLSDMHAAIAPLHDPALEARVAEFAATARILFRQVEEDPRDLSGARKYLGIYLEGARDASVKFAALQAHHPDMQARRDYEALLSDLETTFSRRTSALVRDDRTDLDTEIGVLRERLTRE